MGESLAFNRVLEGGGTIRLAVLVIGLPAFRLQQTGDKHQQASCQEGRGTTPRVWRMACRRKKLGKSSAVQRPLGWAVPRAVPAVPSRVKLARSGLPTGCLIPSEVAVGGYLDRVGQAAV